MPRLTALPLLLLLSAPALALAQPTADYRNGISGAELQQLAAAEMAAARVSGQLQISSGRGYPPCSETPTITPQNGNWSLLKVTCSGKRSWSRHIRTSIRPTVPKPRRKVVEPVSGPLVASLNKSLKKGAVITAADLVMKPAGKAGAEGSFSDPRHVIGQKLGKNLGEGRAVLARHLQKRWVITKDMPVAIQFSTGTVMISTPGVSLQNGELGELVEVRNLSSGTVLKGVVSGPQKITVRAKTH